MGILNWPVNLLDNSLGHLHVAYVCHDSREMYKNVANPFFEGNENNEN